MEANDSCPYDGVPAWWARKETQSKFPIVSHAAAALLGFLPGSGALECDIGGFRDIIGLRCGSLGAGMVEATMVLKLNKDLASRKPTEVDEFPSNKWRAQIPNLMRIVADDEMALSIVDVNEEEVEEDGGTSDSDEGDE